MGAGSTGLGFVEAGGFIGGEGSLPLGMAHASRSALDRDRANHCGPRCWPLVLRRHRAVRSRDERVVVAAVHLECGTWAAERPSVATGPRWLLLPDEMRPEATVDGQDRHAAGKRGLVGGLVVDTWSKPGTAVAVLLQDQSDTPPASPAGWAADASTADRGAVGFPLKVPTHARRSHLAAQSRIFRDMSGLIGRWSPAPCGSLWANAYSGIEAPGARGLASRA